MTNFNDQVTGIDTSEWQDNSSTPQEIDWTKPRTNNIKFVINRASFGTYEDSIYAHSINKQRELGYLTSAYGFYNNLAGAPTIENQAKKFASIVKSAGGVTLPAVFMDYERANSNYPELPKRDGSLDIIKRFTTTVEDILGIECGLYTSASHIRYNIMATDYGTYGDIPTWLAVKPLWVAAWVKTLLGEDPIDAVIRTGFIPNLYNQWNNKYTIWQFSEKGDGILNGMESYGLDMNKYNGTYADMLSWAKHEVPTPEPPVEIPDNGDVNMWEDNVMIAAFNKVGNYNEPTTVDFNAIKAMGFSAVLLRAGSSTDQLNYDDPSANFADDIRYGTFLSAAKAAGLMILVDYDFNAMLDSVNAYDGSRTLQHLNFVLSGGKVPNLGGGLLLNCERNTWYESGNMKTCVSSMYGKDLKNVFNAIWDKYTLVPGVRTGRWFLDKQDTSGVAIKSQIPWLDMGNLSVPIFFAKLEKTVGSYITGDVHDLIADVPDPATTYLTINNVQENEQAYYLYFGNQTKWMGWELAWVKNSAVKDKYNNDAMFRAILWDGNEAEFRSYFNISADDSNDGNDGDNGDSEIPSADLVALQTQVNELEAIVADLSNKMNAIVECGITISKM